MAAVRGKGKLSDLSPLQGMPLTTPELQQHAGVRPVAAARNAADVRLYVAAARQVSDLSPLQGMPLTQPDIATTRRYPTCRRCKG